MSRKAAIHLLTCEYPPQTGGVGDYTRLLAEGLAAAGEEVHVWAPAMTAGTAAEAAAGDRGAEGGEPRAEGAGGGGSGHPAVERALGRFGRRDLRRVGRRLDAEPAPRRLIVQWVPHGFGCRGLNLAFCAWTWSRAHRAGDRVELMVHEPFLPPGGGWRRTAAALVQRLMMAILLHSTRLVWLAIPAWERLVRPWTLGRWVDFRWLPVPSTLTPVEDASGSAEARRRLAPPGGLLAGHLGTYGRAVSDLLAEVLPRALAARADLSFLLLGDGSDAFRRHLVAASPALAPRLHATGRLSAAALSRHLAACDAMLQPYPDGVSTRRTTAMACLAHGLPLVTTLGPLSEALWEESDGVATAPVGDPEGLAARLLTLLEDQDERRRMAAAGRRLYAERFCLQRTVAALRDSEAGPAPAGSGALR